MRLLRKGARRVLAFLAVVLAERARACAAACHGVPTGAERPCETLSPAERAEGHRADLNPDQAHFGVVTAGLDSRRTS